MKWNTFFEGLELMIKKCAETQKTSEISPFKIHGQEPANHSHFALLGNNTLLFPSPALKKASIFFYFIYPIFVSIA